MQNHPGIRRQELKRSSKLSQPPTQPATEQPRHSRVNKLAVRLCRGSRGSICKRRVTEDFVLDQLAGRAKRAVGHGGQQGCVYLHPLIKGVDFDSRHLFRYVELHSKGNITESVQGAQMDGLPMLCQYFNVRQHLGRVHGEVCGPEGKGIGVDRVQEAQLQDATVWLGAWHRHVHVVQVELWTPGLQAGLTGLIHIRGPWAGGTRRRLMRTRGQLTSQRTQGDDPPCSTLQVFMHLCAIVATHAVLHALQACTRAGGICPNILESNKHH